MLFIVIGIAETDADCEEPRTGIVAFRLMLDEGFTSSINEPNKSFVVKVNPVTIVCEGGALTP